jgi:hypothetical protein
MGNKGSQHYNYARTAGYAAQNNSKSSIYQYHYQHIDSELKDLINSFFESDKTAVNEDHGKALDKFQVEIFDSNLFCLIYIHFR